MASTRDSFSGWIVGTGADRKKRERERDTHREIKKCIRLEDFHKALVQVCFFQNPPFNN